MGREVSFDCMPLVTEPMFFVTRPALDQPVADKLVLHWGCTAVSILWFQRRTKALLPPKFVVDEDIRPLGSAELGFPPKAYSKSSLKPSPS